MQIDIYIGQNVAINYREFPRYAFGADGLRSHRYLESPRANGGDGRRIRSGDAHPAVGRAMGGRAAIPMKNVSSKFLLAQAKDPVLPIILDVGTTTSSTTLSASC